MIKRLFPQGLNKKIKERLMEFESLETRMYQDSVHGYWTIGVGRNLSTRGISRDEALYLLQNDIDIVINELRGKFPDFDTLHDNIKLCWIDMAFNLGVPIFLTFKRMIQAVMDKDFDTAADNIIHSKYANQVGHRALKNADLLRQLTDIYSNPSPSEKEDCSVCD